MPLPPPRTCPTAGCARTAPGRALVTLTLECAFVNGGPTAGEQMTFGRIRVRATSGLCPNTTYRFRHPFGTETFTMSTSLRELQPSLSASIHRWNLSPGVAGADLGYLPPGRTRVARRREPGGESGGESGAAGVGWP